MEYRLTVGNYTSIVKHMAKGFAFIVVVLLLIYYIFYFILDEKRMFDFVYLITMPCFLIVLFITNFRNYSKENIVLSSGFISSKRFGQIDIREIEKYKLNHFKGFSLIITTKSGKKFIFSPRYNISSSAELEFSNFFEEFERQMTNYS
jgi:HJR/Mrr/RecB family endonuclease